MNIPMILSKIASITGAKNSIDSIDGACIGGSTAMQMYGLMRDAQCRDIDVIVRCENDRDRLAALLSMNGFKYDGDGSFGSWAMNYSGDEAYIDIIVNDNGYDCIVCNGWRMQTPRYVISGIVQCRDATNGYLRGKYQARLDHIASLIS